VRLTGCILSDSRRFWFPSCHQGDKSLPLLSPKWKHGSLAWGIVVLTENCCETIWPWWTNFLLTRKVLEYVLAMSFLQWNSKHPRQLMPQYLTFLVSKITHLGCCVSRQVTEVSTFILHLKLYFILAFLSGFIVVTYYNMTSFWLWKSAEITQNTLNSATRNNYELALFSRVLLHPTSAACVCKSASNCVLSTNLKTFSEKLSFWLRKKKVSGSEKSCEGLCGPRQKSLSNCSLQIQQQVWQSESIRRIDLFSTTNTPLVFISELQTVLCWQTQKLF